MRLLKKSELGNVAGGTESCTGDCTAITLAFIENCTLDALHEFTQVFHEVVSSVEMIDADLPKIKSELVAAFAALHKL